MAGQTRTPAPKPSFIDPDRMYTRAGFITASGIAPTRLREARLQGLEPKWLAVGRRLFVRGGDAIAFVEQLAELTARQKSPRN
jgi:hypothetical protein